MGYHGGKKLTNNFITAELFVSDLWSSHRGPAESKCSNLMEGEKQLLIFPVSIYAQPQV